MFPENSAGSGMYLSVIMCYLYFPFLITLVDIVMIFIRRWGRGIVEWIHLYILFCIFKKNKVNV